jgi:hypothetical protein
MIELKWAAFLQIEIRPKGAILTVLSSELRKRLRSGILAMTVRPSLVLEFGRHTRCWTSPQQRKNTSGCLKLCR